MSFIIVWNTKKTPRLEDAAFSTLIEQRLKQPMRLVLAQRSQ